MGLFVYGAECRPQDSGVTFRSTRVWVTGSDSVPRLTTCLEVLVLFKGAMRFLLPKPPAAGGGGVGRDKCMFIFPGMVEKS